ncbi:MAG TPA: acetylxylan esterase [Caulobacterales bacterium]|nr:acetylxylan esterase [Caulobacterales bacterium]
MTPAPAAPPVEFTAEQDHARLMQLLGIREIRPGRNGMNPNDPNYANYDESKANPFPDLPDPLRLKSGREVATAQEWWSLRRPEIVEDFDREIYGRVPAHTPRVAWVVNSTETQAFGAQRGVTRHMTGRVDNRAYPQISVDIELHVTLPADARGPAPVILCLNWIHLPPNFRPPAEPGPSWKEQILAHGFGYAELDPASVQADNGAGLTRGVIGLCNRGQPRKLDDWGALRAWAWGASRALDFFETDPAIDATRVGVEGHSRYGKAALVAMAYDRRFAIGFISSSGMGGANLARRNWGEIVENLAGSGEYHWMAGNYIKYAGPLNAGDMPVDAHELIALCAPRPVFISAGAQSGDGWVDAHGMFMAAVAAGPVYRMLGAQGLPTDAFPPIETALVRSTIAYRQHSGGHTPGPNWPYFLSYADDYFTIVLSGRR